VGHRALDNRIGRRVENKHIHDELRFYFAAFGGNCG